jgi:hypothetical protein
MNRLFLTLIFLAACTSVVPPAAAPSPADRYARVPFDTAWHRTITFFTDNHVPIQNVEKASGLLVSSAFRLPMDRLEAWADCGKIAGGGSTLDWYKARNMEPNVATDFNVVEHATGDSTAVRVSLVMTVTSVDIPTMAGAGAGKVRCVSNGQFETALLARVAGGG